MSLVNVPEISIQMAIPMVEVIISGRRLNRLSSHAFSSDIMKRVIPTNIDTWKASIDVPISYKYESFSLKISLSRVIRASICNQKKYLHKGHGVEQCDINTAELLNQK